MLAFVFWHWPEPGVDIAEYEGRLGAFHEALARADIAGFQGSAPFRVKDCPWLGPEHQGYEDWYFVTDFAALESLNVGAVGGEARPGHDRVAGLMAGGIGAVYGLHSGSTDLARLPFATWISKPRGLPYAGFYAALEPCLDLPRSSLWRRQLVLGPAPEFCLATEIAPDLPALFPALALSRRALCLPA